MPESYSSISSSGKASYWQYLALALVLTLGFICDGNSYATTWNGGEEKKSSQSYFEAMRCSQLTHFNYEELKALVHPKNREHFREFCIPEDLLNCSDYNSYLYQLGYLKHHDGHTCRFVPKRD
ncbi:MAG: hypothetical protein ACOH5I_17340 [Oligoflexus sp.]